MGIIKNTVLRGSDGVDYIFLGQVWRNVKDGSKFASSRVQVELERLAIQRKLVEGDSIFQELLDRSIASGYIPEQNAISRKWMQNEARDAMIGKNARTAPAIRSELLMESSLKSVSSIRVGHPVMFYYDALNRNNKKILPYFDQFPVIVPIKVWAGGFMGLNLHYLNYKMRAILLDSLYSLRRGEERFGGGSEVRAGRGVVPMGANDRNTRIDVDYAKLLAGVTKYRGFKSTIHSYIMKQVKSRVVEISPIGWTLCFFLPVARFNNGVDQRTVWRDSIEKEQKQAKK